MGTTTIQVSTETRERETYDELLQRLMALIPEGDDEGLYTQAFRVGLLDARLDVKEGRLTDHREVKRRLGL